MWPPPPQPILHQNRPKGNYSPFTFLSLKKKKSHEVILTPGLRNRFMCLCSNAWFCWFPAQKFCKNSCASFIISCILVSSACDCMTNTMELQRIWRFTCRWALDESQFQLCKRTVTYLSQSKEKQTSTQFTDIRDEFGLLHSSKDHQN